WIYMWKRDLTFCWDPRTPAPRIAVGADTATLAVPRDGGELVLARASRRGDTLVLSQPPEELKDDKTLGGAYWQATSTLSLAVALHGFPLVRSQEHWDRCYYADGGPPESL